MECIRFENLSVITYAKRTAGFPSMWNNWYGYKQYNFVSEMSEVENVITEYNEKNGWKSWKKKEKWSRTMHGRKPLQLPKLVVNMSFYINFLEFSHWKPEIHAHCHRIMTVTWGMCMIADYLVFSGLMNSQLLTGLLEICDFSKGFYYKTSIRKCICPGIKWIFPGRLYFLFHFSFILY